MVQVGWTARAILELEAIHDYIAEFSPGAAIRMKARLQAEAENLARSPDVGRLKRNGDRDLVTVPPYIIRYRRNAADVIVLRVRHGARRPLA